MKRRQTALKFAICILALLAQGCSKAGGSSSSTQGHLQTGAAGIATQLTSQALISWTANLGEQTGFYIEQSTDGTNFTQVETVSDGTLTTVVKGLTPGVTYSFRIRAYNAAGDSDYSQIVTAAIPSG